MFMFGSGGGAERKMNNYTGGNQNNDVIPELVILKDEIEWGDHEKLLKRKAYKRTGMINTFLRAPHCLSIRTTSS